VLPVDVDGGKTIAEFQAEFADVRYELVASKSHGKPKGSEPPCDRYHVAVYLDRMVTDIAEYTRLKDAFVSAHPYCDKGAKDVARFFYGNRLKSKQHEGKGKPLCVDAILAEAKAADSVMPAAPQGCTRTVRYVPPSVLHKGGRNAGLYEAACALLAKYDDKTLEARAAYNAIRCEPELPQGERDGIYSRAQAHHDQRKASGEWTPPYSGNAAYTLGISREAVQDGGEHAALFAQAKGAISRIDAPPRTEIHAADTVSAALDPSVVCVDGDWHVYNETQGKFERGTETVRLLIRDFACDGFLPAQAKHGGNDWSTVKNLCGARGINAVLTLMGDTLNAKHADFDKLPSMLNCAGIAVDLRTGESRPATPADRFTQSTNCRPEAGETPVFDGFFDWVTNKNKQLAAWIMRWCGYSMTGEMSEQVFVDMFGETGGNGKGVLCRTIAAIMGDYAGTIPQALLLKGEAGRYDSAALYGKRLVFGNDIGRGTLNVDFIKALTGGDKIDIERKFSQGFAYKPRAKLVYSTNHELHLTETGGAIKRRLRCIPFTAKLEKIDKTLEPRMLAEAPGILYRFIQEAKAWYAEGFPLCEVITKASADYIERENIALDFVSERCERVDGARTLAKELYTAFKTYRNDPRCEKDRAFYAALKDLGFSMKKGHGNTRVFEGLAIKAVTG
jgi:P4 family phage/plasmid primase-like protien